MKVAVFGTGAIGGYIGGRLARAGHQVAFIARGAHLAAIRTHGLTVREVHNGEIRDAFVVRAPATDDPATIGPVDVVLLGVKAFDTDTAGAQTTPLLGPQTALVTIQNGLDAPARLATLHGPDRIVAGTTSYTATVIEPGVIHRFPPADDVALAPWHGPASAPLVAFADALGQSGVHVTLGDDPRAILWDKFLWIGPVAAITAVARATYGDIFNHEPTRALYVACINELVTLAAAEGVHLDPAAITRRKETFLAPDTDFKSSLQRDFEKGRRTEIEELLGSVVRRGIQHAIPTPHFATLYATLSLAPKIGYHYAS